ncbi:FtsX-like permease family protein [uncultured Desulfobacter sp.]|uniref:ABC transporter permease n=1 Tax=uncultured Desulfobacter sp. TaxID=240139 RepID=UPI002AAC00D6|nr:FtsX-like permease family protein [uncultured Desulfobacter sp.]
MEILMAWRNLRRNPRRTILTVLAIAFACLLLIFMLSMQIGTYEVMINASVKTMTGHAQVIREGYNRDHKIRQTVTVPDVVAKILNKTPHVTAFTFRGNAFALLSSHERTCAGMVTGIDPLKERAVSTISRTIRTGGYLNEADANQCVIGTLLAKKLKINVGDELVLLGSAMDGSIAATVLTVKGIFESGMDDYDRAAIQIPLAHFQEVFAMRGAVHEIVIICDSLGNVDNVKQTVTSALARQNPGSKLVCLSWGELNPGLVQSIEMDLGGGIIFYIILLVMVAFSIMNTFVMTVFERTRELGTLIAIGARPGRLSKMLMLESGFLTLCGIALGVFAGCSLTLWLGHTGIPLGGAEGMLRQYGIPGEIRPKLTMATACAGPCLVFVITILTALYPALKVHRINPVQAMRAV